MRKTGIQAYTVGKNYKQFQKDKNVRMTEIIAQIALNPKPAQDNDGWIEWKGGECPVAPETPVEIKYKWGNTPPSHWMRSGCAAVNYSWSHGWGVSDIIAYRIIEEPKEEDKGIEAPSPKITTEYLIGQLKEMHFGLAQINKDLLYYAADDLEWMGAKIKSLEEKKEPKKQTLLEYIDEQSYRARKYLEQR